MIAYRSWVSLAISFLCAALGSHIVANHIYAHVSQSRAAERARVAFSHALPQLDGNHLEAKIVEVTYAPGESSTSHSHPCPVIGYVIEGAIRTQVRGESEAIYKVGESFYEAPNGVHQVSANASRKEQAKFLAYFVCDHDTPLSVEAPVSKSEGGM